MLLPGFLAPPRPGVEEKWEGGAAGEQGIEEQ